MPEETDENTPGFFYGTFPLSDGTQISKAFGYRAQVWS